MPRAALRKKVLNKIDHTLERHSLKKTPLRRHILLVFAETKNSLTQADLIDALSKEHGDVDRVSVYRNLTHLKAAGILHEVEVNSYIFCSHECDEHAHLLLFCQRCHKHQEVKDHRRINSFMSALGIFHFFGGTESIFLRGICSACTPSMAGGR